MITDTKSAAFSPKIGISSSCFYPLETEKALKKCGELGFKNEEIFINSLVETSGDIADEMRKTVSEYGMNITSVHAPCAYCESAWFFSEYERKFSDGLESYKRVFEFAASVEASFFVIHGAKDMKQYFEGEKYAERYLRLYNAAKEQGLILTQENVKAFKSGSLWFMKNLKKCLGDDLKITLDIKQSRRTGVDPIKFLETFGSSVVHIHVSDYIINGCPGDRNKNNDKACKGINDCIPPGEGMFDFGALFSKCRQVGYEGKFIIELYDESFITDRQLTDAAEFLSKEAEKI